MMLMGFGDPPGTVVDPTAYYTDGTGITCRQYETITDASGNVVCNQCGMIGNADVNGNPISCPGQVVASVSQAVIAPVPMPSVAPSPVAVNPMSPPDMSMMPMTCMSSPVKWMYGLLGVAVGVGVMWLAKR